MRYEITVKAYCTNVKNIYINQEYPIKIQCLGCQITHPKSVVVSNESVRLKPNSQKVNMQVKCHGCDRLMTANIIENTKIKHVHWLDFQKTKSKIIFLSSKKDNGFCVSHIECNGFKIIEVDNLTINVLAEDNSLFEDIKIDDGFWIGEDERKNIVKIEELQWEINLEKKK
ncbi:hypothetical protein GVAV_001093 [Gurleya vavrai]